jgi:hypothetical protein
LSSDVTLIDKWESSNPDVASVLANGKLVPGDWVTTGYKAGEVTAGSVAGTTTIKKTFRGLSNSVVITTTWGSSQTP